VLITVDELAASLEDPRRRILHASTSLVLDEATGSYVAPPLRPLYDEAHVPGSLFADVPGELAHPEAQVRPHPSHRRALRSCGLASGIDNYSHVVVYDAARGLSAGDEALLSPNRSDLTSQSPPLR
jgi:thiosulfate/3-mercaptopyruvate sulfurtransferase